MSSVTTACKDLHHIVAPSIQVLVSFGSKCTHHSSICVCREACIDSTISTFEHHHRMNQHHCKIQSFSSSSSSSSSSTLAAESIAFWLHERTISFESKSLPVRVRQRLLFRKRPCRSQRILQLCSFVASGQRTIDFFDKRPQVQEVESISSFLTPVEQVLCPHTSYDYSL